MVSNELYHHGIRGMKWGIRRFQNKDGSLTILGKKRRGLSTTDKKIQSIENRANKKIKKLREEGKAQAKIRKAEEKANKRIQKAESKYKKQTSSEKKSKPISEMTDDEIRAKINRIKLEKELASLAPKEVSKGKAFVQSFIKDAVIPAAKDSGKKLVSSYLDKLTKELVGADNKNTLDALRKEVDTLELKRRKVIAEDFFAKRSQKEKESGKTNKQTDKTQTSSDSNTRAENNSDSSRTKVYGEGTSKGSQKKAEKWWKEHGTSKDGEFVDVEYTVVKDSPERSRGQDYTSVLLDYPIRKLLN